MIIILVNNHGFGSINNLSLSLGSKGFGNQYKKREIDTNDYTGDRIRVDYIAHAKSMGIDAVRVQKKNEFENALNKAKKNTNSILIEVLVDKNIRVPGYGAWWDVPVAEVSASEKVKEVRVQYDKQIKKERDF